MKGLREPWLRDRVATLQCERVCDASSAPISRAIQRIRLEFAHSRLHMATTEHLRHHVRPPTELDSYSGLPRSDAVNFALCRGALFATGPAIDAIAAALSDAVPPACRAARERRDGASHHITLIPKIEAPDAIQEPDVLEELARCPFVPLGLATASRAWFIPCLWPAAQAHRAALGLPPCDFHITLGFDGADVHGIRKGPLQLLPPWSGTSLGLPEAPASALRHTWRPVVCGVLRLCADAVRRDAAAASDLLAALDRLEYDATAAGKAAAVAELQCTRGSVLGAIGRTAEAAELANAAIAGLAGATQARALLLRGSCLLVGREVPAAAAAVWVAASALAEPSQLPADPDGAAVAAELKRLKQLERRRWEREWLGE